DAQNKLEKALAKLKTATQPQWQLKGTIFYAEQAIDRGKTALLFSTEGSQYPQMLADLCLYFPQVRAWFDFLDETFDRTDRPSQVIFPAPTGLTDGQQTWASEQLFAPDLATETVSTASLAVYEALKELGIPCDVMVGHSAGEHVAARAAGMADFTSRSHLKQELQRLNQVYHDLEVGQAIPTGVLLSVGAVDFAVVQKLLDTYPDAAYLVADNCPSQVLVFVNPEIQSAAIEFVKTAGGICTPVPFDRAYHTPLFQAGTRALRAYYSRIALGDCSVPVYSCATAAPYPSDPDAIRDLSAEQWVLPVRFRETIQRLYADGVRTFIEVGANNTLSNFVDNILQGEECLVLPTNTPRRSGLAQIQAVVGRLWVQGVALELSTFYRHRQVSKIDWQQLEPPASPYSMRLKMLLPRITLDPEVVPELQAQLNDAASSPVSVPAPVSVPSPTSISTFAALPTPASEVASSNPPSGGALSQPNASYLEETPASNRGYVSPPPVPPSQAQQHLLAAHFDLMQTFLRNQAQVSTLVFQQIRAQSQAQQEDHNV
ncbi:MAG TPA: acyltransferase domain-containing protein, partial [Leptolyngbyaceae cyanobacterium]